MELRQAGRALTAAEASSDARDSVTDVGEPAIIQAPSVTIERGTVLAGRYQVEAIIGKGGSGVVLRVFDRVTQMPIAIKILKPELAAEPRWLERFSRELRLARQIQHPNVCRVFDIDTADGHSFLTIELATGGTLRESFEASAPARTLAERIADARAAIRGLAALHEAGVLHRDVKPDNFLRMEDGRLVLSDFGLATSHAEAPVVTVMVGTPSYMAPEVVMGEPASARSDVWSLGVVLHEVLFGSRPEWEGSRGRRAMRRPETSASFKLGPALAQLCAECLAQDVADRPADAREVDRRFQAIEAGRAGHRWRWWRRVARRWALQVLVAASAAGVLLTKVRWWPGAAATSSRTIEETTLAPAGTPANWSGTGELIAAFDGRVHCHQILPGHGAMRVIWGSPRRAEDIDLTSGGRRPSPLLAPTFETGCPQLSPDGRRLLFAAPDDSGIVQVRLSESPDGASSRPITAGYEPLWLRNGDEFLYSIDGSHSAVFSLPTMSFALLLDGIEDRGRAISEKAVSQQGDLIALLLLDERAQRTIAVFENPALRLLRAIRAPAALKVSFEPGSNHIVISHQESSRASTLVDLDWRNARAQQVGFLTDADITTATAAGNDRILLARTRTDDVWLHEGVTQRRRLTTDGENMTASISKDGVLLVGRRTSDGKYAIWSFDHEHGHAGRQITAGPLDVMPSFAPDGRRWTYVDYRRGTVMLCELRAEVCRILRRDEALPMWPTFSPDGKKVGYLTQTNTPHLLVVPLEGAPLTDLGPVLRDCPPIWSASDRVWIHQKLANTSAWVEKDSNTGVRTGRQIDFPESAESDTCWWPDAVPNSPFFRSVTVEQRESARLIRVPS